ncbi:MAG: flagellar hook-length control protein FliK [Halomonadaceae bacterium]|nr:MAG: flagellar hook-length control protein FliK [Halomonadaceae bacterium]
MQSPSVLADVTPSPRSTSGGRPDDRRPERAADNRDNADSFRDMQSRARERAAAEAANADRSNAVHESTPALSTPTGLSEAEIEGLLTGELSIEQLLAESQDPMQTLEGLQQLAEVVPAIDLELAQALAPAGLNMGLTENILARSYSAPEGGVSGPLGTMNSGNGTGKSAKVELSQALQALASADGDDGLDLDEAPARRVMALGASAETTDSPSQPRSGDNLTLQQSANGLRLGEAREPAPTLKHYTTSLETSLDEQDEWHEKMAAKLSWLTQQGLQSAEIHINPADLGPIEVRIQVQNDQATVTIQAQHASVREMLEQNSLRLKDMLQEQGMDLAGFDVSEQTPGQAGREDGQPPQWASDASDRGDRGAGMVSEGETVVTSDIHLNWNEGIDLYA